MSVRRIAIILSLFLSVQLSAQRIIMDHGKPFMRYGAFTKALPHWGQSNPDPDPDPQPDPFTGTLYKEVTFSELPPDQITDARARTFMQSTDMNQFTDNSDGWQSNDSTVIMDNDTVWQVIIQGTPQRTNGTSWYGHIMVNGANKNDDTLTAANLTYYIKFSDDWNWANGGKLPGMSGVDRYDLRYPPGGGVKDGDLGTDPGGEMSVTYYEDWDGWSTRMGFDYENSTWCSSDGEVGHYVYHQGFVFNGSDTHYGDTWNSLRSHSINTPWVRDTWYKITSRVVLNTPGQYDGIVEFYRNDTCIAAKNNVRFRNYSDIYIDYFFFDVFSGGDTVSCFKNATMKVWMDDMFLWTDGDRSSHSLGYVFPNVPVAGTPNVPYNPGPVGNVDMYTQLLFSESAPVDNPIQSDLVNFYPYTWYLGNETDGIADDAEILISTWGGETDTILRSYLPEGQCCSETTAGSDGGTGINWEMYIDELHANGDYDHGYMRYTWRFDPNFDCGDGGKMPGVHSYEDYATLSLDPMPSQGMGLRTMYHAPVGTGQIPIYWYIYTHQRQEGGYGMSTGVALDTLTAGVEYDITLRWYVGTASSFNGFVELFVNDTLVSSWTGLMMRESSSISVNCANISTFAGGSTSSYDLPLDTYVDISELRVFDFKSGTPGVPAYNVPSSPGRILNVIY